MVFLEVNEDNNVTLPIYLFILTLLNPHIKEGSDAVLSVTYIVSPLAKSLCF